MTWDSRESVFEARSRVTGLSYVGRTRWPIAVAWTRMIGQAKWGTKPLQLAIARDGPDSFDVVCLLKDERPIIIDLYHERLAQIGFWPESYNLPGGKRGRQSENAHETPTPLIAEKEQT